MDENYVIEEKPYRYNVVRNDRVQRVVCFSKYAQKTYVGIATCSPDDSFDLQKGKKLAKLRCDRKINKAKFKYIQQKLDAVNKMRALYDKEHRELVCLKIRYMKDNDETEDEFERTVW